MTTYVMESMAYLTALNLDDYEEPDMSVEAAIVKVRNIHVYMLETILVHRLAKFFGQ